MGNRIAVLLLVAGLLGLYFVFEHHLQDLFYSRLAEKHSPEYVRRYRIVLKLWAVAMLLFVTGALFWPEFPVVPAFFGFGVFAVALSTWAMRGGWRW